ncbi:MAG: CoA ester lyase [Hydrogenophaga sp.]|jgi:citrate lyase subunit beta/citryl-CoA lyase|uniref:HpcH/HpaI aldolase/citrate lyase family protein n=1 Tax=Hydrogenophaga sp. TaxID=1904254 RepID=UPI000EE17E50|nr:CoA ester lyase [Hydrogenophaga sp.]MDD3786144.1 CoA ester lyase [Hydrogenophaga sp.]MDX9969245.1 CoA ester lyase [Hydrogenophaga sp.]HAJ10954.1 CoA ester lyase [Comamonadaceae bacterium]
MSPRAHHQAGRCWLFVPADSASKLAHAGQSSAYRLILDLEDGVGPLPEHKQAARAGMRAWLGAHPAQAARVFVRINALDSAGVADDVRAAVAAGAAGVVLPKCEGPADVRRLGALLDDAETAAGAPSGRTGIVAIVTETARGVQCLPDFRAPLPRLQGLMWGAEDLCADLQGATNRDPATGRLLAPYRHARDACLIAARACGAQPIDAVYTAFRDEDGLRRECIEHRALGFGHKAAIHPAQVAVIDAAFEPDAQERAWAKHVLKAFEGMAGGVAQLDGRMLDMPHLRRARQILGLNGP